MFRLVPYGLALAVILVTAAFLHAEEQAAATPAEDPVAQADARVTASDREHWAYQPVAQPEPPAVKNSAWVRNPIDRFVLAKLEAEGWEPAAPATPEALLRRMSLDVIGLPPTLAERTAFLDQADFGTAADLLADDLLSRTGYGERWGRHWLDLVRYADTNGYERDGIKPHVWRYRDWVIRSLNDDKPYNRFLLEQFAGDELPDADTDSVIALGYYRLGPWDDEPADLQEDRFDQLDDMVATTAQAVLGLTLNCARCHDHKFDALSQVDYYRMVAVFNTLRRHQAGRGDLDAPAGNRAQLAALAARDAKIAELSTASRKIRDDAAIAMLKAGKSQFPAPIVAAFLTPPSDRTQRQKLTVDTNAALLERKAEAAYTPAERQALAQNALQIQVWREATPDLPLAYYVHEPSPEAPPTHLLVRGRANRPGALTPPGVPTVLVKQPLDFPKTPLAGSNTSGHRLTLARWLVDPANPLTARVIVNRVWQHHFGEGLVRTPSDFGLLGLPPSHPELLDWLASQFVKDGWSLKKLHRLILTSQTYRMSHGWREDYAKTDPENERLWRMPYHRLEVETIRDAMLAVSGKLNPQMYGPSFYEYVPPEALAGSSDPNSIWKPFDERDASRRTIYALTKRSLMVPMFEVLDLCDTTRTAAQRQVTSVAPQALTLFNGQFVNRQAKALADRLAQDAGPDPTPQIRHAWLLALSREPRPNELAKLLDFLATETPRIAEERGIDTDAARKLALEQLARGVLNLNEFVYPE